MGRSKSLLARWLPVPVLRPIYSWHSKRVARAYRGAADPNAVFTDIFKTNAWGSDESVSGHGSAVATTRRISAALPDLCRRRDVKSIFDAPCGDFQWMRHVDLAGIDYTGGDIVAPLVEAVRAEYAGPGRSFVVFDLVKQVPPPADLIFCRDCFIHLPFAMVQAALANFRASGAKYLLTTTYTGWPFNYDTIVGGARAVDLCQWPFELPEPLELIAEDDEPPAGEPLRCMGLWPLR